MSHVSPTATTSNASSSTLTSRIPNPIEQSSFTPIGSSRMQQANSTLTTAEYPGLVSNLGSNYYTTVNTISSFNPNSTNLIQNEVRGIQKEKANPRQTKLEEEFIQRRDSTKNIQQIGFQLLQSQMDVQEQILQYQFMLEQCMESLDYQNCILNGQAEELAFLRKKLQYFEKLMDSIKQLKKGNHGQQKGLQYFDAFNLNFSNVPNLSSLQDQSHLSLARGSTGLSHFQPNNQNNRLLNSQSSNPNGFRSRASPISIAINGNAPVANPVSIFNN